MKTPAWLQWGERISMGDFVWYCRQPHVILRQREGWVELIRFEDRRKRTFWRPRRFVRPFSVADYDRLLDR